MRNYALLIRKDFISAQAGYTAFPLLAVVWLFLVAFSPGFIPLGFTLVVYAMVIALFLTEENDLVCNVLGILPIRRRQAVVARYLYAYAVIFVQAVLTAATRFVFQRFTADDNQWPVLVALSVSTSLLMAAISIPLIYRFGVVKMRFVVMVIYAAMIGSSSAAMPLLQDALPALSSLPAPVLLLAAVGISFLLSLASLSISLQIKK